MPTSKELKNLDSRIKKTLISSQSFKKQSSFDVSKSILGIHKNISSLAGSVRRVVIRVGALEKAVQNNSRKITSLKNISALQGPQIRGNNIGAKLPGSSTRDLDKNISIITDAVSSIAETLKQQYKTDQKTSDYDRRKKEQEKRGLAEGKLEKRFDGIKRLAQKIIAPVKSFLDRILDFFKTVILGRIVYKIVEWMGDPKNASKVKSIIRFVKDWWPALLASYVLFGNSFSGLIRGTLGMVARFTVQLARVAIPSLLRIISANPITSAIVIGATAAGIGAYQSSQQNKKRRDEFAKTDKTIVKPEQTAKTGRTPGGKQLQQEQILQRGFGGMFRGGGLAKFSGGGFAEGYVSGEKGVDKVPAMLSDGEFVMSVGAVEKYGVDTLEAMNASGGGTNKPKVVGGKVYAASGGRIGDIPLYNTYGTNPNENTLRRAARAVYTAHPDPKFNYLGIPEDDVVSLFKKLGGVPNLEKVTGVSLRDAGGSVRDEIKNTLRGLVEQNKSGSFTQSSRSAAGLDDLARKFDLDAKTAPRYAENLPRLGRPTPRSRFRPGDFRRLSSLQNRFNYNAFRGQSSLLPEDYFLRGQSSLLRSPPSLPTFNRYRPGATIRATGPGMEMFPELQRFVGQSQVMESSIKGGGRGGLVGSIALTLAEIFKPQIQSAIGGLYNKMGIGMGNLSNSELKKQIKEEEDIQKAVASGPFGTSINIGSDRLNLLQQEAERRRIAGLRGGAIKGGYGLKKQAFKDMPKTQIMTDDKGRPFVGYKAMRGGKPVYIRGPQAGAGSKNIWENLGRMINPGAYKKVDEESARRKYREAATGSLSSLKARGASQATIARTKKRLNAIGPPIKSKPRVIYGPPIPSAKSSKAKKSASSRVPQFTAGTKGMRSKQETLGLMR